MKIWIYVVHNTKYYKKNCRANKKSGETNKNKRKVEKIKWKGCEYVKKVNNKGKNGELVHRIQYIIF